MRGDGVITEQRVCVWASTHTLTQNLIIFTLEYVEKTSDYSDTSASYITALLYQCRRQLG